MDYLLELRNASLLRVKTNGIFKIGLLLFQYSLLVLVWIGSIQYLIKAGSF